LNSRSRAIREGASITVTPESCDRRPHELGEFGSVEREDGRGDDAGHHVELGGGVVQQFFEVGGGGQPEERRVRPAGVPGE
jgi:hypothetical protein